MCQECDWEDALEQCQAIEELIDDLPERAEDFADSVLEKIQSIASWIEEKEHVTEGQLAAIENMHAGVSRWLE